MSIRFCLLVGWSVGRLVCQSVCPKKAEKLHFAPIGALVYLRLYFLSLWLGPSFGVKLLKTCYHPSHLHSHNSV